MVAGIGVVQNRNMVVCRCQQSEPHDAKRLTAFLAVAALGEGGVVVETVDEGEKVGGIEQQLADIDLEVAHHVCDDIGFDVALGVAADAVHVVPEPLAGEFGGSHAQQARQCGPGIPVGHGVFRAWCDAAVDDGDEHIGPNRDSLGAFGDVLVDDVDEFELPGEVEQCGRGAEFMDEGGFGDGGSVFDCDNGFCVADVGLGDNFGLAVDTFGLACVVVGVSLDFLAMMLGIYRSYTKRGIK